MSKKNTEEEPKARALTSTNSDGWEQQIQQQQHCTFNSRVRLSTLKRFLCVYDRLALESDETDLDVQLHCSSSLEAEPEKAVLRAESPPLASAFTLPTSFEEDVLDLKWRQSIHALLCPPTPVLSLLFLWFWMLLIFFFSFVFFFFYVPVSWLSQFMPWELYDINVCVFVFTRSPSASVHWVFVLPRGKWPKEAMSMCKTTWFIQISASAVWSQTTNWM